MSTLGELNAKLEDLKTKLNVYDHEIENLKSNIDGVVLELNNQSTNTNLDSILSSGKSGFSLLNQGSDNIPHVSGVSGIVDYSVSMSDLTPYDDISLENGEKYTIYSNNETGLLYIISDIKDSNVKKDLFVSLKDKLSDDQMVIVTFDGNPYKGDVYNSSASTVDFGMVAKNGEGKMMAFNNSGGEVSTIPKSELIVSYNGLALPYHGVMFAENGASFDMEVKYQNANTAATSKQVGLRRCALLVQKKDPSAEKGIGQDTTAEFVINDPVLENACYRILKQENGVPCYLDAKNDNKYTNSYHTVFRESIDEYQAYLNTTITKKKYDERKGFLGVHDSTFPITLKTYHSNEGYWNSFNFTLTGNTFSDSASGGEKQMWATTDSYIVDDWNNIIIK